MIYFIVTTSLFNDCAVRRQQYIEGISRLKKLASHKIIIVENNGKRKTFLDELGCDVLYTDNNRFIQTENKGYVELKDVIDCMDAYDMTDSDFVVKMSGRYLLHDDSEFMRVVNANTTYECVIKYGSYMKPVDYKMEDCITGLIGMSCRHIRRITFPERHQCVEWMWARATYGIDDDKLYKVSQLGIDICPENVPYFKV